jgi:hypothetical protein
MNTPEKLIKVEGILKQLEDNLMKLNEEFDAKKAEIDAITNIKNSRLQVKNFRGESIKEKKAFGQKIAGFFGKDTANTARRLSAAKAKLQQTAYGSYMIKVDEIRRQYQQYSNIKEKIEFEIQRGKEMKEKQEKSNKNAQEKNKIEKQKLDLIPRYTKLGYTYVPEKTKYENSCAGLSQQAIEYSGGCTSVAVKISYTDSFQYITETKEPPTDGKWTEEKQTITIPAKYEQRIIPGTKGSYAYQGQGTNDTYESVKVADEREEVVSVWKRDLPAGFPEIVNYADFPTKINELESKSNSRNVQSRKRKQNRKQRKTRKQ